MTSTRPADDVRSQYRATLQLEIKLDVDNADQWRSTISAAGNHEPLFVSSESYVEQRDLLTALELAFRVMFTRRPQSGQLCRIDTRFDVAVRIGDSTECPWLVQS